MSLKAAPPITPLPPAQALGLEAGVKSDSYILRVLIEFDIFVNVICNGHPGETISSRAARAATQGKWWGTLLSSFLDLFEKDKGETAEATDIGRAEVVINLESQSGNVPKETVIGQK